ncbi:hypothetical protein NKH77_08665 [Streptomyces sp. M19]
MPNTENDRRNTENDQPSPENDQPGPENDQPNSQNDQKEPITVTAADTTPLRRRAPPWTTSGPT